MHKIVSYTEIVSFLFNATKLRHFFYSAKKILEKISKLLFNKAFVNISVTIIDI